MQSTASSRLALAIVHAGVSIVILWFAGTALGQMSDTRQQQALDSIKQYAIDMNEVLPCVYMAMDPKMRIRDEYGDAEVSVALKEYAKGGASSEQVTALRRVYSNYSKVNLVVNVKIAGKACFDNGIIRDLANLAGKGRPLLMRPPFVAP